jgi:hypothetical protein
MYHVRQNHYTTKTIQPLHNPKLHNPAVHANIILTTRANVVYYYVSQAIIM